MQTALSASEKKLEESAAAAAKAMEVRVGDGREESWDLSS